MNAGKRRFEDGDLRAAEQLNALIVQRQAKPQQADPPPSKALDLSRADLDALDADEAALALALVDRARSETPDAAFIERLGTSLQQRAEAQNVDRQIRWVDKLRLPRRVWQPVLLALVMLATTLLAVPPTRAAILGALGLAFTSEAELSGVTVPVVEPLVEPGARPLSLAELRAQSPVPVPVPQELPEGFDFVGGALAGDEISLVWRDELLGSDAVLLLVVAPGELSAPPLLEASQQQPVAINGEPGVFVRGNWRGTPAGADDALEDLRWDETVDVAWLTWRAEGLTYLLVADGLEWAISDAVNVAQSLGR